MYVHACSEPYCLHKKKTRLEKVIHLSLDEKLVPFLVSLSIKTQIERSIRVNDHFFKRSEFQSQKCQYVRLVKEKYLNECLTE